MVEVNEICVVKDVPDGPAVWLSEKQVVAAIMEYVERRHPTKVISVLLDVERKGWFSGKVQFSARVRVEAP